MYRLIVLPRARQDANISAAWYDEQGENLSERFFLALRECISAIVQTPLRYPKVRSHYRQRLMDDFPFFVVYRINQRKATVTITSVFHTSRNPKKKFGRS